jgi:hypothetical protein
LVSLDEEGAVSSALFVFQIMDHVERASGRAYYYDEGFSSAAFITDALASLFSNAYFHIHLDGIVAPISCHAKHSHYGSNVISVGAQLRTVFSSLSQ